MALRGIKVITHNEPLIRINYKQTTRNQQPYLINVAYPLNSKGSPRGPVNDSR